MSMTETQLLQAARSKPRIYAKYLRDPELLATLKRVNCTAPKPDPIEMSAPPQLSDDDEKLNDIIDHVCIFYLTSIDEITSPATAKDILKARWLIPFLAAEHIKGIDANRLATLVNRDVGTVRKYIRLVRGSLEKEGILSPYFQCVGEFKIKHDEKYLDPSIKQGAREVIMEIANRSGIAYERIISESRYRWLMTPRFAAMYVIHKAMNRSLTQTGKFFANRDHSSVHYAVKQVEESIKLDGVQSPYWPLVKGFV